MKRPLRAVATTAYLLFPFAVALPDTCNQATCIILDQNRFCNREVESCPTCYVQNGNLTYCFNETSNGQCTYGIQCRNIAALISYPQSMTPLNDTANSLIKSYVGIGIWVFTMICGVLHARRMLHDPGQYIEPRRPSIHGEDKDAVIWMESHHSSNAHLQTNKSNVRSSNSQSIIPSSMRSLASIASTNLYITAGTIIERSSKPADVNVPMFVYRESESNTVISAPVRWHTELQDLSEETYFESMRTRISNLTMLDCDDVFLI